ncbi:polynucleotide adenylyltransferase [Friedmanniomyces endolithicus]|nr:polynucleotide adenylyltransferase [Friedmanniomyces endolithicus]
MFDLRLEAPMWHSIGTIRSDTSKESNHSVAEKALPGLPLDSSTPQRRHTWIRRICVTLWIWETLSLLTSATCIGAIVVLLSHYDGKPLPNWKYGLTMNGVISILAVVTKASMMLPVAETLSQLKWCWFWKTHRPVCDFESFDGASRGPWGSLMMLLNVPLWSLGTLGAGLTVAAMFVEPALQQLPAYPSLSVTVGGSGLGRSLNFTDRVPVASANTFSLSEGFVSAIYMGIFGSNESVSTSPSCATGNCTWPTFSTLAVCSACEDLTPLLIQDPMPPSQPTSWMVSNSTPRLGPFSRVNYMYYAQDSGDYFQTAFPAMVNHSIVDFQSIYWPPESTVFDPPSGVFECVLYFCVKTLSASTINGRFSETVVATWPPVNLSLVNEPDIAFQADLIHNSTYGLAESEHRMNFTLTPPGANFTYTVDRMTFDLLRFWMTGGLFSTTIAAGPFWDLEAVAARFYNELTDQLGGNKTIFGYNIRPTAGPGRLMTQVATSLTTFMRQSENPSHSVVGNTIYVKSFVQARWYWLISPVSLLLLILFFMLSTITLSARRGIPTWKSSSLAVLIHGLDELSCRAMTDIRLDKMETKASEFRMAVQRDQGMWASKADRL